MEADPAQHPGEGHLFSHHSHRLGELALSSEAHIAGHIDPCRTSIAARDQSSFAFCPLYLTVEQGSRGADLYAGAAELAAGLLERRGYRPGDDLTVTHDKTQGANAAEVLAYPDAAGAADAKIVVLGEQRLVFLNGQVFEYIVGYAFFEANKLDHCLELAVAQLGAAALFDGYAIRT
jgi:hypothetical protein